VADMLALLISRAKEDEQINGLVPHLVEGGLSILQYADDTILFMDHNIEQATHMKLLLCVFEQLSGFKINFHKSELFCYGETKECEEHYTELFGCGMGQYPFKYLGLPMHHKKISNEDWKIIEDKFEKETKLLERKDAIVRWPHSPNKLCFNQSSSVYVVFL
jgi:hypothetical protein